MSAAVRQGPSGQSAPAGSPAPPADDPLFAEIASFPNLLRAARLAVRGKRRSHAAQELAFELEPVLLALQRQLADGSWRPGPYRLFTVCEPKRREIAAAPLADRIVHHAACAVVAPRLDAASIDASFACRVGKGAHRALAAARALARRHPFYLKADVRRFFESVDHATLKALLRERLAGARTLALLDRIVDHGPPGGTPGKGLPIGNLTSQHFANFYLARLDRAVGEVVGEANYLRYMDDFVAFAPDKPALHEARRRAAEVLRGELRLALKEPGTFVAPVSEGVPFVGARVFPGVTRLAHGSWARTRRLVRRRAAACRQGTLAPQAFLDSATSAFGHLGHAATWRGRRGMDDGLRG